MPKRNTNASTTEAEQQEDLQTEQHQQSETDGPDQITVDTSAYSEVILGSAQAAPLPQTWERVDF